VIEYINDYFERENEMNLVLSTLLDVLLWRAQHQPAQRIYTFLVDRENEEVGLTYKELDKQSRVIGAKLQSLGKIGDRVLLLYQPGLEFITAYWGCLYSGFIAVPIYPPNPHQLKQAVPRFGAKANDVNPLLTLTTSSNMSKAELLFSQVSEIKTMHCLATDEVDEKLAEFQKLRVAKFNVMSARHNIYPEHWMCWGNKQ